ncbi:MAG: cupin domain-containing protein [Candidatus Thorarchaeota archaeon]|nr:MAG: cupin domain-containing protein [Candidatus Thorarchaeota archaeon]
MVDEPYPEAITSLPRVKLSLPGVKGWLAQGESFQVVFFDIEPGASVPLHSHGAQFGFVIDGEMMLTIGGETKKYVRGDSYYIPADVEHGGEFLTPVRAMDFFADRDRYEPE